MYDLLLQTSPEPIFIYDVDNLKFLEVNDSALKMYGYSRDEFLQMDLTDLYAPEDIQTLIESSNKQVVENVYNGPFRHRKKDGNSVLVKISKSTIDFSGRRAHFNIVKNVTEAIEKEKDFQAYQYLFENSNDVIVFTDIYGFVNSSNKKLTSELGYSQNEISKVPFGNFVAESDRERVNSGVFRSGHNNEEILDLKILKKNKSTYNTTVRFNPLKNYSGVIEGFVVIFGEEKKMASPGVMAPAAAPAESHDTLDSGFLSHLFHEILTPINVIIGFGQELIDSIENPTAEQIESTDIIQENQKSLLQVMDTAAEFASLVQQNIDMSPENMLFIDLIEELEGNSKRNLKAKGVEFAYGKISSSLSFSSDKQRIVSLFTQFLGYAISITHNKKIFLSAQNYDNDSFIVSIKDEKFAISEELLEGLKDVFSQDENIVRQRYGFSRFSVRLVRKLLALLTGRTGVIRKSGKPAEYGIILPLELEIQKPAEEDDDMSDSLEFEQTSFDDVSFPQDEIAVHDRKPSVRKEKPTPRIEPRRETTPPPVYQQPSIIREEPAPRREPQPEPVYQPPVQKQPEMVKPNRGSFNLSQYSCLYLEDQVDSQILFKVQMKELNNIEVSSSVEGALPMLEVSQFDFIVMDINLQGEYNGLDALRFIRQLPNYQTVPIIAVTAYVLPGDREKFIQAGFDDFISKPVLKDNLVDVLKLVMARRQS